MKTAIVESLGPKSKLLFLSTEKRPFSALLNPFIKTALLPLPLCLFLLFLFPSPIVSSEEATILRRPSSAAAEAVLALEVLSTRPSTAAARSPRIRVAEAVMECLL